MARRKYSDETKAAVMAALVAGQGVEEVAKQYKIPVGTVKSWGHRAEGGGAVATDKKQEIGELLVEYLREALLTLQHQARHFRDPDWLRKQSAQELAVLHGVQTDKAVRLLEALGDGGEAS